MHEQQIELFIRTQSERIRKTRGIEISINLIKDHKCHQIILRRTGGIYITKYKEKIYVPAISLLIAVF